MKTLLVYRHHLPVSPQRMGDKVLLPRPLELKAAAGKRLAEGVLCWKERGKK